MNSNPLTRRGFLGTAAAAFTGLTLPRLASAADKPNSVFNGVRIGCTYMPEQEVVGWHWHDTDGLFLDACALPGKKESECYFLVERLIDGEVVQCIEQQAPTRANSESRSWLKPSCTRRRTL